MSKAQQYMVSRESGLLQIPYQDYMILVDKLKEAARIREVKKTVQQQLSDVLGGMSKSAPSIVERVEAATRGAESKPSAPPAPAKPAPAAKERTAAPAVDVPPIKKEIAAHFNAQDDSGRIFNVFTQYYTCINDICGGTVRVTMKDGVCSFWNYDAWEEFAFADIHEGNLRFAVDPRYTDDLSSMNFCEVSRLLAGKRNLISVEVSDLSNTMLKVMAKAFEEVMAAS